MYDAQTILISSYRKIFFFACGGCTIRTCEQVKMDVTQLGKVQDGKRL
jgi:hypothetical protein